MPAAHYFLGSRLLCSSPSAPSWSDELPFPGSVSLAYLCPSCGSLWAQVSIDGQPWSPVVRHCLRHATPSNKGGTFHHPWQRNLSSYPREVLQSDALAMMNSLHLSDLLKESA
jgi:hypothetical protein